MTTQQEQFKQKVENNFSLSVENYHKTANIQKIAAKDLANLFPNESTIPQGTIIEIGCGTGFISKKILSSFPSSQLIFTDISPKMVAFCKQQLLSLKPKQLQNNNLLFKVADGEFLKEKNISCIISGLSFQWFLDFFSGIKNLFSQIKKDGYFIFSCLTDQTFKEWKFYANKAQVPFSRIPLPSFDEMQNFAKQLDPKATLQKKYYTCSYSHPKDFFSHLKKIGVSTNPNPQKISKEQWGKLFYYWTKDLQKEYTITYEITFIKLKK